MHEFNIVFEITNEGFTEWRFALPGILFLAIGVGHWKVPFFNTLFGMKKEYARKFGMVFVGFSILWVTIAFVAMYFMHGRLVENYLNNNFEVIEGIVESYEKDISMGNIEKGFKLENKKLWHGNMPMGPDFMQPALKKITLKDGMLMRITVSGSSFMKVEIANQKSVVDTKNAQQN